MLSLDFIRQNKEQVIAACKNKNRPADIEKLLWLDEQRKTLSQKAQKLREERNLLSKQQFTQVNRIKGKQIKEELKKCEDKLILLQKEIQMILIKIPNLSLPEVPIGKDASANQVVKQWGTPPKFNFPFKDHIQLGIDLDIIDLERGAKVSGYRGYFLKNQGAILHFALLFYAFNKLIKKGYTPLIAPAIVKDFALFGSGQFPWGEQEVYSLNEKNAYLSGTAEVPVTAYYANEILADKDLPKKMVAFSSCFRKEAGSYGKDTRGLYRLHEFWKVEQLIIMKNDIEAARKMHEELQTNTEEILQDLKLPYQKVLMCTGEMGEPHLKKYDTETWMPSRNSYGETMSNSIMGDFQTRRLKIRYRNSRGQIEYCYSLNNTAIASPRLLIAILENNQQSDGSILVPEVLQPLVGFTKICPKPKA